MTAVRPEKAKKKKPSRGQFGAPSSHHLKTSAELPSRHRDHPRMPRCLVCFLGVYRPTRSMFSVSSCCSLPVIRVLPWVRRRHSARKVLLTRESAFLSNRSRRFHTKIAFFKFFAQLGPFPIILLYHPVLESTETAHSHAEHSLNNVLQILR